MNARTRTGLIAGTCLLLGAAGGVGGARWWEGHSMPEVDGAKPGAEHGEGNVEKAPEPGALVRTVEVVEGDVHRTIEAMGVAAIPAGAASVVAWPADAVLVRLLVQPGQAIEKDAPLAQIAMTRDAESQIALAQQAVGATARTLQAAQDRLDRGLTTRPEVLAAQTASDESRVRAERLRLGMPPIDGILRAPVAGMIGAMRAPVGATVGAGTPIVEIIAMGAVVAQLGVEPADAREVAVGQAFEVRPLDERDTARYHGSITLVGAAVNAASRMPEITVALSGPELPRAGTALRASCALPDVHAMLVPRGALVPDGDGMIVFVVRDGKAMRTPVVVSRRAGDRVAIGSGCVIGDRVVVVGQGQLSDGAAVREERGHDAGAPKGAAGADR